ncbi:MAG: UPF0280 family protein [Nanoarchaeota archaeon]|nr:UPF0280 family protein [Nanoarchaeota archaeon]
MYNKKIVYKDSKLNVFCDKKEYLDKAMQILVEKRKLIEDYITNHPKFLETLEPLKINDDDPPIIKAMKKAATSAGVGPMATVAGTLAETLAKVIIKLGSRNAIVDNGGDLYVITDQEITIGLFSGKYANLGFKIKGEMSICSSSKMGHSLSLGDCDLATIFSIDGSLADACATACANMVKNKSDIKKALDWVNEIKGIKGAIIIKDSDIGMIGDVPELIKVKEVNDKITIHPMH